MKQTIIILLFFPLLVKAQNTFPASGNVGIGTMTPTSTLSVIGNIDLPSAGLFGTGLSDHFIYESKTMGHYAMSWMLDSTYTGGDSFWLSAWGHLKFFTNGLPRMLVSANGNVGIGNVNPQRPLDVTGAVGSTFTVHNEGGTIIGFIGRGATITGGWAATPEVYAITYQNRDFAIGGWRKSTGVWAGASLYINSDNGNVLIGQTTQANANYKLDVAGAIRANQLVVNTTGADFVFDSSYRLSPLSDLEKYIQQQHHLPQVSSAAQMGKEGLDIGENQTVLLQKIEELTLYAIEADKRGKQQDIIIARQQAQLSQLQQQLNDLQEAIKQLGK